MKAVHNLVYSNKNKTNKMAKSDFLLKAKAKAQVDETSTEVTESQIILTKEQFAELKSIVWDNKLEELEDLGIGGEDDMKVIGFTLGSVYSSLKAQFEKIEEILDSVEPQNYSEFSDEDEEDNW